MLRKTFVTGATILALFSVLFISPAAAALDTPPASQVTAEVVAVLGTGCQPGTVAVAVAPDNRTFTMAYDKYVARVGVGAAPTDFRKNCHVNLSLDIPEGYSYMIARIEYHGSASLVAGATGMQRGSYYYGGQSPVGPSLHTFTGPLEDNWQTVDESDLAVLPSCGQDQGNLNLSTELRVRPGTSDPATTTSTMAMNPLASTVYHLRWRHCP